MGNRVQKWGDQVKAHGGASLNVSQDASASREGEGGISEGGKDWILYSQHIDAA